MGEVVAPRGVEIGAGRDAFRAFMLAHRLVPTQWAKAAGVPAGEVLAYLTGRTRMLSQETVMKLARAADTSP
jgi:plasmid maintenance system antidote protein VapI